MMKKDFLALSYGLFRLVHLCYQPIETHGADMTYQRKKPDYSTIQKLLWFVSTWEKQYADSLSDDPWCFLLAYFDQTIVIEHQWKIRGNPVPGIQPLFWHHLSMGGVSVGYTGMIHGLIDAWRDSAIRSLRDANVPLSV